VNALDIIIVAAVITAAFGGWRLGFVTRAASWVGLLAGLILAFKFLPNLFNVVHPEPASSRVLFAVGLLVGAAFLGQALGLIVGSRFRHVFPPGPLRTADRAFGGVAGVAGVLVVVWLALPQMADVPAWPARMARTSALARAIDDVAPAPPDWVRDVRRLVGNGAYPRVFDALRPSTNTGPPPANSGLPPDVAERVAASTVKISGQACGRIQEGSGFAAGPNLIVTNAHVVAGERHTTVMRPDGVRRAARVIAFDSDRDLAVLQVNDLGESPLAVGTGHVGMQGAVFGHPGGQDQVRAAPAAVRQEVEAVGRDLYDQHRTKRDVFILAAELHPGDSGGAVVDDTGTVVGVAFAIAPDKPTTAYALTAKELGAVLDEVGAKTVDTGPCLVDQ
jgi:S1-C subfamily serine protease